MSGCGRHFCPGCGEELIHRDNRKAWESASAFGQVVWREGPARLTTGDIDHYAAVFKRGGDLLRLIEHKQPKQGLGVMQMNVLSLLGEIIEHAVRCENFKRPLDQRSGVFLVRGDVGAEQTSRRSTCFQGPQALTRISGGQVLHPGPTLDDAETVFRWLEGTFASDSQSGPRRAKELPAPQDELKKAA